MKSKTAKVKKPKFKLGDMVYSWQNPTFKASVGRINLSDDPKYPHSYRLTFYDKDGYSTPSKWMPETSLFKRKQKKY